MHRYSLLYKGQSLYREKEDCTCMLSTNSSCSLYLCQSTFGYINWEEPHGILNRVMGICPIIQLSSYTKHPSVLTTPSNIALWHQPKTLNLSNHWLYIYLNLFQDKIWSACCQITFQAISDKGRKWTLNGAIVF